MSCPSCEELLAFHLGDLADAEIVRIGQHLADCPRCEAQTQRLDALSDTVLSALRRSGSGAVPASTNPSSPEVPGYDMLGLLARGGMSAVYKAKHRRLGRLVALKCLRADCAVHPQRFQAEAEAVARLQHPNIVQIFEVGESAGQPFLALEFLDAGTLAEHLGGKPQDAAASAALVQNLARAVHHAHIHGIVHRDLKPANILLSRKSESGSRLDDFEAKISDFGVAKHLQGAGQTREGDIVGTARYMSPEQAAGLAEIGPASDIYGLGVILYEMLTGRVPLQGATDLETVLLVQKEEPVSPRRLQPGLPRDLETICLKCLRKEPSQRYASAENLAEDLGRWSAGEPIAARPTPRWERAWKWARRRPSAAGLCLVAFLIVGIGFPGAVYLWWQSERAHAQELHHRKTAEAAAEAEKRAKHSAEEERAIAQAVNDFFNKDLLGQADIGNQPREHLRDKDITVREVLDRAAEKIDDRFRHQETTQAAIRHALGGAYRALGEYALAHKHLELAVALRNDKLGARHRDTLQSMNHLAGAYWLDGRHAAAEALYNQVLEEFTATRGVDHPDTLLVLGNLAMLDADNGRHEQAESRFKQVVAGCRAAFGVNHARTLHSMHNLAVFISQRGRLDEAESLSEEVVAGYQRVSGADHPRTLQSMNNLATTYLLRQRYDKAEPLLEDVLKKRQTTLGPEHVETLQTIHDLAAVYLETKRAKEAEPMLRAALKASRFKPGPHHPCTHKLINSLARVCHLHRNFEEAETLFKEVLDLRRAKLPEAHPETLVSMHNLGVHYRERGLYEAAAPLLTEALEQARRKLPSRHPNFLQYLNGLAVLHAKEGKPHVAEGLFRELTSCIRDTAGLESSAYGNSLGQWCQCLVAQKKHAEAESLLLADYDAVKNVRLAHP